MNDGHIYLLSYLIAKLPPGTVEALLKDPATLKKILLYHVIPGKLTAKQLNGETKTANGASVNLTTIGGALYANEAKILKSDIKTANGYVQVIDTVLLPPDMKMSNIAATMNMRIGVMPGSVFFSYAKAQQPSCCT